MMFEESGYDEKDNRARFENFYQLTPNMLVLFIEG